MANEQNDKTEKATPKRREKERNRGNIAKSQDFTSSLMLTFGVALLCAMGPNMNKKLMSMLSDTLSSLHPKNISDNDESLY